MQYTEFTGKTVDEAVEKGLKELGLAKENADIRVLEEGKKKLFGSVKARVEIAAKNGDVCAKCDETTNESSKEETCEKTAKKCVCENKAGMTDGERTVVFLEGLFELLHITACTELVSEGEKVEINVTAANTTSVIGKRGVMLDAIQTLAGAVANTGRDEYKRVVVDCENYRENREATLNKLAENLAQKAIRLGKKIKLEPMNPYERRIIHAALSEREGVSTQSEGKEPNRYIVVVPDNLEDPDAPALMARNDRRGGHDRRDRGGRGGRDSRGGYGGSGGRDSRGSYNKKPYNRDRRPSDSSAPTGGTSMKASNDFFGIFLGNSGNTEEDK
ncbi:MAG: protein jag [Clostridia bacterium]|nr:protein jag [Clostridia bacterium]